MKFGFSNENCGLTYSFVKDCPAPCKAQDIKRYSSPKKSETVNVSHMYISF